jgi:hypothetical protein
MASRREQVRVGQAYVNMAAEAALIVEAAHGGELPDEEVKFEVTISSSRVLVRKISTPTES